jgi:DNA-directed RNA polymerase specialized sigma24 family protein
MSSSKASSSVPAVVPVTIPSTRAFLAQWHNWVSWKVSKHFKRNKERIPDTAQRARLRLLQKEFVARWFFKHLTESLVDLEQAQVILGGKSVTYVGKIVPVHGRRSSPDSLWKVSDLLKFARFDYDRYFYSAQGHTIESAKFLRLLGYGAPGPDGTWIVEASDYSSLESLYRQGKIKPSELTEHECTEVMKSGHRTDACSVDGCDKVHYSRGYCSAHYSKVRVKGCAECDSGRESLNAAGVSLVHRWNNPEVLRAVTKLRWNDKQLIPFLRDWRSSNMVKDLPKYIMRPPHDNSVEAGLKKYAYRIIYNDVINSFKSIGRTDELSHLVLDGRLDPGSSDEESVGWESSGDADDAPALVVRDPGASAAAGNADRRFDIKKIIEIARLSPEETEYVEQIDLGDVSPADVADLHGVPVSKVHRVRTAALLKMREAAESIGISSSA